jgi:hypothetical protein
MFYLAGSFRCVLWMRTGNSGCFGQAQLRPLVAALECLSPDKAHRSRAGRSIEFVCCGLEQLMGYHVVVVHARYARTRFPVAVIEARLYEAGSRIVNQRDIPLRR